MSGEIGPEFCYEGIPSLAQILAERNPPLWAVILEWRQIEKEMRQVRKTEGPLFFQPLPVARRRVARVLRVLAAEGSYWRRA